MQPPPPEEEEQVAAATLSPEAAGEPAEEVSATGLGEEREDFVASPDHDVDVALQVDAQDQARSAADEAFAAALAADDLAAWEAFARAEPSGEHRVEAGRRIEALGADRPGIDALRRRLAAYDADQGDSSKLQLRVLGWEIGDPGEPPRLLVKDSDYRYLAIQRDEAVPFPEGFERPALRYLPPRSVLVARLPLDVVVGDEEALQQAITGAWFGLTTSFGLDYLQTRLKLAWPDDPIAGFEPETVGREEPVFHASRAILANALTAAELAACLDELPPALAAWARERLDGGGGAPTLEELVHHHVAMGAWRDLRLLDGDTLPLVRRLCRTPDERLASRALEGLAWLDPTGRVFDTLDELDAAHVEAELVQAVLRTPEIALSFEGERARSALRTARVELAGRLRALHAAVFRDEVEGCRHLLELGWTATSVEEEVRIRGLAHRWDLLVARGEDVLPPLLEIVAHGPPTWVAPALDALAQLGERQGPSRVADDAALASAQVRAALAARPDDLERVLPLFGADARGYLDAMGSLAELQALAARAPRTPWAALAAEWEQDAGVRDVFEWEAAGKLTVTGTGKSIRHVHLDLRNLTDHPLEVRIPGTLQFTSSGDVQNMVTLEERTLRVDPLELAQPELAAACANLDRPVPGLADRFTIGPIEDEDLLALTRTLSAASEHAYAKQAAVWAWTDDASYEDMGKFLEVRRFGQPGSRAIGPRAAATALRLLEHAGLDFRSRMLWQDREFLLGELEDGPLRTWLSER